MEDAARKGRCGILRGRRVDEPEIKVTGSNG